MPAEGVAPMRRPDGVGRLFGHKLSRQALVQGQEHARRGRNAGPGMVDHQQIVALGQGGDGLVGEGLQGALVPHDFHLGMAFGEALGRGNHGQIAATVIPGDAVQENVLHGRAGNRIDQLLSLGMDARRRVGRAQRAPIRTKLRNDIVQKFWICKQLERTRMFVAPVDASFVGDNGTQAAEQVAESAGIVESFGNGNDPVPHNGRRLS